MESRILRSHIVKYKNASFFHFSAAKNAETNEDVAIKKVGNAFENRIDAKRILREIKLMRHMDHENVRIFLNVFSSLIGYCFRNCKLGFYIVYDLFDASRGILESRHEYVINLFCS